MCSDKTSKATNKILNNAANFPCGITKAFDIFMGYSMIAIIELLLDLNTCGPFAVACCSSFFQNCASHSYGY